ncbi:hypothetical protein PIB30_061215 [Stylosanthes scabra]|uniref:Uncharacterized protein n=1 Tax=Stylosanthes scabra TaxID=79078 RepID=A0ABU6QKM9_9FABA|nr:hypothetical protein [Stylosanthes scabra]
MEQEVAPPHSFRLALKILGKCWWKNMRLAPNIWWKSGERSEFLNGMLQDQVSRRWHSPLAVVGGLCDFKAFDCTIGCILFPQLCTCGSLCSS